MVEDRLYNWLFHYNKYKKLWFAFRREDYIGYFNGDMTNVVSDPDFDDCKHKALLKELGKDV